jgi:glycosyltransferase involved in cell wall biosynthesis
MEQGEQIAHPKISVVIASVNGPNYTDECLEALEKQTLKDQAEVIVVDCCGDGVAQLIRQKYPQTRLIRFAERKTIPELRAIGMKNARGDIIVITEDHCLAEPRWYERMLAAHQEHYGAIGGAVENDVSIKRVVDWAVYFCEYSKYLNPVPAGEVADIPGNNTSYRREFLAHIADMLEEGTFWENFLNGRLQEKGIKLYSDPSIIVYHKKVFGFRYFVSQRYHYGRSYAGMRLGGAPYWKRLIYAAFCPLLPVLLIGRIGWRVWTKKRHRDRFLKSFPFLGLFTFCWAWGEFVGYLFGPGESLLKVE